MREDRALKKIERDREKMARENIARLIFWQKQTNIRDSEIHAAEEKGWNRGFLEGCMAMQGEIACRMIYNGYNVKEIKAITGFSRREIAKIR